MKKINKIMDLSLRKIINRVTHLFGMKSLTIELNDSVEKLLGTDQCNLLKAMSRLSHGQIKMGKLNISFNDPTSLVGMIDEIFIRENYKFKSKSDSPVVVDCGANIGLSVLYFKSLYPNAVIHAFEPDPVAYEKLVTNIKINNLTSVNTYNAAVWIEDGELVFETDGSWGGHLTKKTEGVKVQARKLDCLLENHIDFLKIDIEGAETEVILKLKELIIKNVDKLFFEWHSIAGSSQRLGEILATFERNGFRYHIKEASIRPTPFFYTPAGRMDSQLDIFLWK